MIDQRPKVINHRERLGDFEGKKKNYFFFFPVLNEVKKFSVFRRKEKQENRWLEEFS